MLDPYALHLLGRDDEIPKDALARIAKEIGSGRSGVAQVRALFALWTLVAVPLIAFCAALVWGGQVRRLLAWTPAWLPILLFPWLTWLGARRRRYRRTLRVMLRHSRCPHCGYDLRLLPADPADGATVCPECGCAWRLPGGAEAPGRAD